MSYIRECRGCGNKISLRKMPHGKWVAFEPSSQTVHECRSTVNVNHNDQELSGNSPASAVENKSSGFLWFCIVLTLLILYKYFL